ncbi:MAG: tetratricopeptide repeat protein, partial [Candidatus Methylopumilus sp.]|nr:tetratricopeptide repeat protein [Candidatus Methylopumilus sp.]
MNVEKLLPEAINFMRDGEIEKAQSFLNQILKEFPKNPDALTQSGIILIHERKFKKGINLIESSLLIKPNQPEALLHLGIAFYQENKFDQAIKYFDDAIKLQPDYSEAIYTKALSYEKMNLIEDAINNYNLALNKNPNYLNPIINLAYLYFKLENFEIAKNFFIKAQNLNPENNEFSQKISEINNHLGNYDESLEYWDKRILSDPTDADAYNNKAVTLMNLDRLDEAKVLFLRGLELNENDTTLMINLAGLYEEQREYTQAEIFCKKILDLVPHHDKSINMLGKIAIDLGKNDSAHSYINQALNLRPDNLYALL